MEPVFRFLNSISFCLLFIRLFLLLNSIVLSGFHVQELEISLAKKESYIKDLENELTEQRDVNNHQHDEVKLLNERLSNETRRIKSLERESDRLRSEISLLEAKVGAEVKNIAAFSGRVYHVYLCHGKLGGCSNFMLCVERPLHAYQFKVYN